MNETLMAVLLASLAGLSTVIGAVVAVLFLKGKNEKFISRLLGFTIGIFLIIIFHDLIPESYEKLMELTNETWLGIILLILFSFIGYVAAYGLEKMLPEHDHHHKHLKKTSLAMVLAMTLHKFPEGMIIYMTSRENLTLAISLAIVIGIHHIPEGISLALTLYKAKGKNDAIKYSILSGLAVPLGTLFAILIFNSFINETLIAIIFSLVSGIMIFVLFKEIIPSLKEEGNLKDAIPFGIGGIIIMLLIGHFTH